MNLYWHTCTSNEKPGAIVLQYPVNVSESFKTFMSLSELGQPKKACQIQRSCEATNSTMTSGYP